MLYKARLYQELRDFTNKEYDALLTKLKWKNEKAFLELHCYGLLKKLTDDGTMYLGGSRVSTNLHG